MKKFKKKNDIVEEDRRNFDSSSSLNLTNLSRKIMGEIAPYNEERERESKSIISKEFLNPSNPFNLISFSDQFDKSVGENSQN